MTTTVEDFDPFTTHREDPHSFFAEVRRDHPVFHSSRLEAWCVTRYQDIDRVLRDSDLFSCRDHNPRPPATLSPELLEFMENWRGSTPAMGSIDGAEHTRIRSVVGRGFTPRALKAYEERIIHTADSLIDGLRSRRNFNFITEFSYPFPLTVVLDVLGVPMEFHDRCREWTELRLAVLLPREAAPLELQQRCIQGLRDFMAMSRAVVAERLREPREDMISYMLHSEIRGHTATPDDVTAQIPTLISAGHETTAQGLATITRRLLGESGGWARLVDGTLDVDQLVEEGLRHDGPLAGFFRTAVRECEIGGVVIPAGARLFLAYGSGNRDDAVFSDPDEFSPGRANGRSHLAFGGGPHHCVGAALARMELVIGLQRLAAGFPRLALAADQPVRRLDRFPLRAMHDFVVTTGTDAG